MASRYDIRSVIIQTLFEGDFRGTLDSGSILSILSRNVREFLELETVPEFAESVTLGVILKRETLDQIIEKAAPEWPINKISLIDRALLRLGLFELLFGDTYNIPHKVAINEAIELSKAFGGDSSRKFVNGVLGAIYKEMSGEDLHKKDGKKEVEIKKLAGALVYATFPEGVKVAMVYDMFKYWTLPKGKLDEEESIEDCARREVKEEIGIDITIKDKIEENEYIAGSEGSKITKKRVTYFLAEAEPAQLKVEEGHTGIVEAKWFTFDELKQIKTYRDIKPIIEKGLKKII